jgi:dTDP-4-amino-4,6-dideoxygalactose transaminase
MSINVPFMDLKRIHASQKDEILSRIGSIIDRSAFILGSEVESFEKEYAAYVGSKFSLGVANGLDALKLSLQAIGIGPGDEVITAANTFAATAFAISSVGARPVFVDIEPGSYNVDPAAVERAVTSKTKAIMPVHLYGQPATMGPIVELAKRKGLQIIEDCAQAHGATYRNQAIGTFGIAAGFSFYPGKNLGAMGDGGAITTSDPDTLKKLKTLRDVGQSEKYHHTVIGHNSRLDAMQAAILSVKLRDLRAQTEERAKLGKRYQALLSEVKQIQIPEVLSDRTHVFHLYVITTRDEKDRDALKEFLGKAGIQTGMHYPIPLHLQKCYADLGYREGDFPISEKMAKSLISLPIFPGMTGPEIEAVAAGIRGYFKC